jgi:cytochrome c-type biogenesis protein CcmH
MIAELKSHLTTSLPDKDILNWFASKYGPIVLAAPIRGGFDLVAWIVPFAVLILGIAGVIWLVRHWRERNALVTVPAGSAPGYPAAADDLRERIRRDTTYES